jgi:hypothetical protein
MPRPSLDEIFSGAGQQGQRPSLDQIFSQPPQQQYDYQPIQAEQQRPSLGQIFGQQQPQQEQSGTGLYDVVSGVADVVAKPVIAALDALSVFDKPRGAIAGVTRNLSGNSPQDETLMQAALRGWEEKPSFKESFNQDWVKENPKTAAVAGLGLDIAFDPMWIATPAKMVGSAAKASKAIGLTDNVISPAVKAVKGSEAGQKGIATLEDIFGKNRVADDIAEFNAGRATDQLAQRDVTQFAKDELAQYGTAADKPLIDYIESANKPQSTLQLTPNMQTDILDLHKNNKLAAEVKAGNVPRETAADAFRNSGEEIPNYLLDVRQTQARADGVADVMLPAYQYRDEILNSIPDNGLRKAIQSVGDKFVELNTKQSDALYNASRLADESAIHFPDGSHLRRSYEKYDSPADFLEDLRKNGTQEEYAKAYKDLASVKTPNAGAQGFGQEHRVAMKDFAERQSISSATLQKMGVINNAEYRMTDTLNRASKTLREDQFLSKVASDWGVSAEKAAELSRALPERRRYLQIPETKGYGALAGQWVPRDVYQQVLNVTNTNAAPDSLLKAAQTLTSWWKISKLANPSSIMRNFYSGLPMSNVFGEVPMYALPKYMAQMKTIFTKQKWNDPKIRELMQTGIMDNIFTKQELKNILGGKPNAVKQFADKAMSAFGAPDQYWRAVVYSYHRDKGKTAKEAAKIADRALFNYGQAPEWINTISKNGIIPFAKFPYFATKETARALYNRPAQVTKYLKPQNQTNSDDQDKILPEYMRSKTLLPLGEGTRTVNGKEQKVQNNLDISYILPFSNDVSLGNPISDAVMLARTGQNAIGMDVIKPGMTKEQKVNAFAKYLFNAIGPSAPVPGTYAFDKLYNGATGGVDAKGRQYDLPSSIADVFGGVRNVPLNVDELYRQKIGSLEREKRDTAARIAEAQRDQRYTPEQRKQVLMDFQQQLRKIAQEQQEAKKAYDRQKKIN